MRWAERERASAAQCRSPISARALPTPLFALSAEHMYSNALNLTSHSHHLPLNHRHALRVAPLMMSRSSLSLGFCPAPSRMAGWAKSDSLLVYISLRATPSTRPFCWLPDQERVIALRPLQRTSETGAGDLAARVLVTRTSESS